MRLDYFDDLGLTRDELEIAKRWIEGGGADEAILAYYASGIRSPEETLAGLAFDEALSGVLGRKIEAWQPAIPTVLDPAITSRHAHLQGVI